MSKKQKYTLQKIKSETTELQFKKLEVLYDLFKKNVSIYNQYKKLDDKDYLNFFVSTFRSPIWDISSANIFKTGLKSNKVLDGEESLVEDHFIQRSKASRLLFENFSENPSLSFISFVNLLVKYGSTIILTKEEHSEVSKAAKKDKEAYNHELYENCNVEVVGLQELLVSLGIN
jgi:hypothetical protein